MDFYTILYFTEKASMSITPAKAVTPPPLTMEEYPPLPVSPNASKAITPLATCNYNSYVFSYINLNSYKELI